MRDGHNLAAALHPAAAPFVGFDQGRLDDVLPAVEDLRVGAGDIVDPDRRRRRAVHEEVHQPDRVCALRDGVAQAYGGQEFLRPRPEIVGPGIRPDLGSLLQDQALDPVVSQGAPRGQADGTGADDDDLGVVVCSGRFRWHGSLGLEEWWGSRRADAGHVHFPEQVRAHRRGLGVVRQAGPELGVGEGRPEVGDAVPDGVVQEHPAAGDAAMQLGRDEAGLPRHDLRVGRPGSDQVVSISGLGNEGVDQDDRAALVLQLVRQVTVRSSSMNLGMSGSLCLGLRLYGGRRIGLFDPALHLAQQSASGLERLGRETRSKGIGPALLPCDGRSIGSLSPFRRHDQHGPAVMRIGFETDEAVGPHVVDQALNGLRVRPMLRAIWATGCGTGERAIAPSTCHRALVRPRSPTSASPAASRSPFMRKTSMTSPVQARRRCS